MILTELTRPLTELKGIGKQKSLQLSEAGIETISDLLTWFPRDYEDRSRQTLLSAVRDGGYAVTRVKVLSHQFVGSGFKKTLKVIVSDAGGRGELLCFGRNFLAEQLTSGQEYFLAGLFQNKTGILQCSRFEFEPVSESPKLFNRILPLYPLSGKLTQNFFRTIIAQAISVFSNCIDDELPQELLQREKLMPIEKALMEIHNPQSDDGLKQAAESLKFREFYRYQLQSGRKRASRESQRTTPLKLNTDLQQQMLKSLPFSLTPDQITAIEEINADMCSPRPMGRLLQGDVGSGKTLVAFHAALLACANGQQSAILVPTELLARQHAESCAKLMEPLGIRPALLTGKLSDSSRAPLLKALAEGEIDIVIGTHALFTTKVQFKNLALVVVDEQHKFGVRQREAMRRKGDHPHMLLMSATPIPRTLAMSAYGDLDLSEIRSRPEGRQPISTHLAVSENSFKVYHRVRRELESGRQAYCVYPRIGENLVDENSAVSKIDTQSPSDSPLKSATQAFEELQRFFHGYRLALIHSGIPEEEKEIIMERFNRSELDLLVATTVVEVGIDNPNATVMVIEHAERFGLAALHQLRGRVGRGSEASYCYLIYDRKLTEEAGRRLMTLKEQQDGFAVAEEDLRIRGPGELLGARQSGQFRLHLANPLTDSDLLERAQKAALEAVRQEQALQKAQV